MKFYFVFLKQTNENSHPMFRSSSEGIFCFDEHFFLYVNNSVSILEIAGIAVWAAA